MSHTVYRLHAADDSLLYIGCTKNLPQRLANHRSVQPWWPSVARTVVVGEYATQREGRSIERALIEALQPPHNIQFTPRWHNGWVGRAARREERHAMDLRCSESGCRACRVAGRTWSTPAPTAVPA